MSDTSGRPWATVKQVKKGTIVETDGDFTCIKKGTNREVKENVFGLYIDCKEGGHQLDGQLSEDGTHYVGLYYVTG